MIFSALGWAVVAADVLSAVGVSAWMWRAWSRPYTWHQPVQVPKAVEVQYIGGGYEGIY